MRGLLMFVTVLWASPALCQQMGGPTLPPRFVDPPLKIGETSFSMPVADYRAPGGTMKRVHGIVVGHEIDANTSVGLGLFKMKPKGENPSVPFAGKSKKVALGLSLRF